MMSTYEKLFLNIDYQFRDIKLVQEALTHNSMAKKHRTYQRLEFLGDRVLGLVVAEMLYKAFPDEQEGDLAKRHASLVREDTLAVVAREIDIAAHLIISDSEKANLDNPAMLSDCCEALIGAMYIDGGFDVAMSFIKKHWQAKMEKQELPPIDGKSALQEWAQGKNYSLPIYSMVNVSGAQHDPEFEVKVEIEGFEKTGTGIGKSKKSAEQNAATDLLRKIKSNE